MQSGGAYRETFQRHRPDYRPVLCRGPMPLWSSSSPCSASYSDHPKALLPLVPLVGLKLHTAAIHSHGWRFRLVRPYQTDGPTRLSLKPPSIRSLPARRSCPPPAFGRPS